MLKKAQVNVKVLGGLPVTVEVDIAPAERDVGIMYPYIDDWSIIAINGRKLKKPTSWLNRKIERNPVEYQRFIDSCYDALKEQEYERY
jgi:hypothetical protein